jgi:hypothetical protein
VLRALKDATNVAYTENGAKAYETTKSYLLDFFSQVGALRNRNQNEVIELFSKAYAEDNLLALKILFYARDIRGGQGERETFKTIIKYLANFYTIQLTKNAWLISEYGRWDDLYALFGTKAEHVALEIIKERFFFDLKQEYPSLLGKWLKSENASSYETKKLAKKTREYLRLTPRQYRKALSDLRARINIVETLMSEGKWNEINYSQVPSKAGLKYRNAFLRNDAERYGDFISAVSKGEAKVNTSALYPYEIVREIPSSTKVVHDSKWNVVYGTADNEDILNAMWDNLPDYIGNNSESALAVVDTSGSMEGLPSEIAISLGIYLAERNKGAFHNHFITFSREPKLVELVGTTFCEKVRNISRSGWDMNTNVEAVFDLILEIALQKELPQSELPSKIFIVSDMEFDYAKTSRNDKALFWAIRDKFMLYGYTMPNLVFWNVDARNSQFPVTITDEGVQLVSGASPSIFKNLLSGKDMSAYALMMDVLGSERYNFITT